MKKLCITVGVSSVLVMLLTRLAGMSWLFEALVLSRSGVAGLGSPIAWVWQIVTHAFVYPPDGLFGAAISLLFLWHMGAQLELRFGGPVLFKLLAVAVLASGLSSVIAMIALGPLGQGVVYGTFPMLVGLIAGFAATSSMQASVSFFGIPMTQQILLIVVGVSTVVFGIADNNNFASIVAGLSAGVASYFYMKALIKPRPKKRKRKRSGSKARTFTVIEGGGEQDDDLPKWLN